MINQIKWNQIKWIGNDSVTILAIWLTHLIQDIMVTKLSLVLPLVFCVNGTNSVLNLQN